MSITQDQVVSIHYTLKDDAGDIIDSSPGGEPLAYRSWAVRHEARPLEREFWRKRDVDLLEQPLEDYVDSLASYLGAPAPA